MATPPLKNEEQLLFLRRSIYLQTLYENTKNGKVNWSRLDPYTFTATQLEPAADCWQAATSTTVRIPRSIWQFYLVRNLVGGEARFMLDIRRNGSPRHSFNSDADAIVGDIYANADTNTVLAADTMVGSIRALDALVPLPLPPPGHPFRYKARARALASGSAGATGVVNHAARAAVSARTSLSSTPRLVLGAAALTAQNATVIATGRLVG